MQQHKQLLPPLPPPPPPPKEVYENLTPSEVYNWNGSVNSSQVPPWSDDALTDLGDVIDEAIDAAKASVRLLPCGVLEETSPLHDTYNYESPRGVEYFRQLCVALGDGGEKDAIHPDQIQIGPLLPNPTASVQRKVVFPGPEETRNENEADEKLLSGK